MSLEIPMDEVPDEMIQKMIQLMGKKVRADMIRDFGEAGMPEPQLSQIGDLIEEFYNIPIDEVRRIHEAGIAETDPEHPVQKTLAKVRDILETIDPDRMTQLNMAALATLLGLDRDQIHGGLPGLIPIEAIGADITGMSPEQVDAMLTAKLGDGDDEESRLREKEWLEKVIYDLYGDDGLPDNIQLVVLPSGRVTLQGRGEIPAELLEALANAPGGPNGITGLLATDADLDGAGVPPEEVFNALLGAALDKGGRHNSLVHAVNHDFVDAILHNREDDGAHDNLGSDQIEEDHLWVEGLTEHWNRLEPEDRDTDANKLRYLALSLLREQSRRGYCVHKNMPARDLARMADRLEMVDLTEALITRPGDDRDSDSEE